MKIFLGFNSEDSQLAYTLKQNLSEGDIDCYLFDITPEYSLSLYEKITNALADSDALIAIISEKNFSASVHQEIGYSIAANIPVIVMMEENADEGVLVYGEKEIFSRDDFENSCKRIRTYLQRDILTAAAMSGESTKFLEDRHLRSPDLPQFGTGGCAKNIQNTRIGDNISSNPVIFFSACPTRLLVDISITSEEYSSWLNQFSKIDIDGCSIRFLPANRVVGLKKVIYYHDNSTLYSQCLEIHGNGFIEQALTAPIYSGRSNYRNTMLLNSCWTAGAFRAFLIFCKNHYSYHNYMRELDIFLSIRDANKLTLMGFGGRDDNDGRWPEPNTVHWTIPMPSTEETNISIPKKIKVADLSSERIRELSHTFADDLANAYGLEGAMCYNHDGTINKDILSFFRW